MRRKITASLAALLMAIPLTAGSFSTAEARGGRAAAAFVGGAALGLLAAEAWRRDRVYVREGCYRGPAECRWVRGRCFYDDYGDRICRPGHRECYRPVYCD